MLNNKKGFTLIEILVVISIVGLLSSVFLVGLSGFRARGRDAKRLADVKSVQNGMELYYTRCARYPGDATCAGADGAIDWSILSGTLTNPALGLGITKIPVDPLAARKYLYGVGNGGQSYVIGAILENFGDPSLINDVDGFIYGIDCSGGAVDTIYCVQF